MSIAGVDALLTAAAAAEEGAGQVGSKGESAAPASGSYGLLVKSALFTGAKLIQVQADSVEVNHVQSLQ